MKRVVIIVSLFIPLLMGYGQTVDIIQNQLTAETYNPATILKNANKLISLGEMGAHHSLSAYAKSSHPDAGYIKDQYVTWLCLLVYEPKPNHNLKTPLFGAPNFPFSYNDLGYRNKWPKFPLTLEKGVPFLLVDGYTLGGLALSGPYYIDEYRANGIFRTKPYLIPNRKDAESALSELISSSRWKALKWDGTWGKKNEIEFLHAQVERISP